MLSKSLNDVLTLHWFNPDRETDCTSETHMGAIVYGSYFGTSLFCVSGCVCLMLVFHCTTFMGKWESKRFTGPHSCVHVLCKNKYSIYLNSIWIWICSFVHFSTIQLNSQHRQPMSNALSASEAPHRRLAEFREWMNERINAVSCVTTGTISNQKEECHIWWMSRFCGFVCAAFTNHKKTPK